MRTPCRRAAWKGLATGPVFELLDDPRLFDPTNRPVLDAIIDLVRIGRVWRIHSGTPCTRWSVARTVHRHDRDPVGSAGQACAHVTVRLLRVARSHAVYICVENPKSSGLRGRPSLASELRRHRVSMIEVDMCCFGALYRKPSSFASSLPSRSFTLADLAVFGAAFQTAGKGDSAAA